MMDGTMGFEALGVLEKEGYMAACIRLGGKKISAGKMLCVVR